MSNASMDESPYQASQRNSGNRPENMYLPVKKLRPSPAISPGD